MGSQSASAHPSVPARPLGMEASVPRARGARSRAMSRCGLGACWSCLVATVARGRRCGLVLVLVAVPGTSCAENDFILTSALRGIFRGLASKARRGDQSRAASDVCAAVRRIPRALCGSRRCELNRTSYASRRNALLVIVEQACGNVFRAGFSGWRSVAPPRGHAASAMGLAHC